MRAFSLGIASGLMLPVLALGAPLPPCPRPAAGSAIVPPLDLYSSHGVLNVALNYRTGIDPEGRTSYCFVTTDGAESPTLHVKPGDTLNIQLKNDVKQHGAEHSPGMPKAMDMTPAPGQRCGAALQSGYSVNMHFHGTNTAPVCHSDEVIHTLVNAGQTFAYSVRFPTNEPPGLYWYHPHIHGLSDTTVLGGASGAIVVEGIEKLEPAVAQLPERILVMRDQAVVNGQTGKGKPPGWDVSLNYVPVDYPQYHPAVIEMLPGQTEFWRVVNASSDTIANLQLKYDGVVQMLKVVSLDSIALGSQDGTRRGHLVPMSTILLPPAGRAEFIVTGPAAGVQHAELSTQHVDTGPFGDVTPTRPIAVIRQADASAPPLLPRMGASAGAVGRQRFEGLDSAPPTAHRHLYFSEITTGARHGAGSGNPPPWGNGIFYITVDGQTPEPFNPNAKPAITTTQGAVEDWTIENRTQEVHEFHIHQIHYQLREINHQLLPESQRVFLDTVQVPYWSGSGAYPSVTLRMDFRGDLVGDFVYHCHILRHEDSGMMAIIRVKPRMAAK